LAKYKEAQKLDPKLEKANEWSLNGLCWDGSLRGYAAEVMTACDLAVERDPDNGQILDSRGVARALTGDYPGAIADFEAYIKELEKEIKDIEDGDLKKKLETYKVQRQGWVDALNQGENQFTEEVLEELLDE
jgi:tetratricopeptide (TPR) repeat protein